MLPQLFRSDMVRKRIIGRVGNPDFSFSLFTALSIVDICLVYWCNTQPLAILLLHRRFRFPVWRTFFKYSSRNFEVRHGLEMFTTCTGAVVPIVHADPALRGARISFNAIVRTNSAAPATLEHFFFGSDFELITKRLFRSNLFTARVRKGSYTPTAVRSSSQ